MRYLQGKSDIKYFFIIFFSYLLLFFSITIISKPGILYGEHVFLHSGAEDLPFSAAKKYAASLWYNGEIPLWDPNTHCGIPILSNHTYNALSPFVLLLKSPGIPEGFAHSLAVILTFCLGSSFICLYITKILECNLSLGFIMGILYNISPTTVYFAKYLSYASAAVIPAIFYFTGGQDDMSSWRNNLIIALLLSLSLYISSIDMFLTNCFLVCCRFVYGAVKSKSYRLYLSRLTAVLFLACTLSAVVLVPTIDGILRSFPRVVDSLLSQTGASNPFAWLLDSISPPVIWGHNEWYLYTFFKLLLGLTNKPYFNGFRFLGPFFLFGLIYAIISPDKKTEFLRDLYLGIMGFFAVFIWLLYDTGLPEKYMVARRFPYLRDFKFIILPISIFLCAKLFQDIIHNLINDRSRKILGKTTVVLESLSVCFFILVTLAMFDLGPAFYKASTFRQLYSTLRVNYLHIVLGFGLIFCCYFLFYMLIINKELSPLRKKIFTVFIFGICLLTTVFYDSITNIFAYINNISGHSRSLTAADSIKKERVAYDEDVKMTLAESFVDNILDRKKERLEYKECADNLLRHLMFNFPVAGGYAAFYHRRLREFFLETGCYKIVGDIYNRLPLCFDDPESPVIDFLSVRYLISKSEIEVSPRWEKVYEDRPVPDKYRFVYKNNKAFNRFFTVASVEIFNEKANLFSSMKHATDLQTKAPVLKEDLDTKAAEFIKELKSHTSNREEDIIHVSSYKSSSLTLETTSSDPKILVITDSWDPGWNCEIDGKAAKIYPFYYAFKGILLPPGKHRVKLFYLPALFYISVVVSLVSLAGVILSLWAQRGLGPQPNHCKAVLDS